MARKSRKAAAKSDALIRRRIEVLLILFSFLVILLIGRAAYWQIFKADWLKTLALDQWIKETTITADRGEILDTNGNTLAISVTCYTIILHPNIIANQPNSIDEEDYINSLSNDLAQILEMSPDDVKEYATKDRSQVVLKRNVTDDKADAIRLLEYKYTVATDEGTEEKSKSYSGVTVNQDVKREYPMGSFLTQVLGFVSIDGIGLEGVESKFNSTLAGENGSLKVETDRQGVKISGTYEEREEPIDGNDLQLTIDVTLQSFAESALDLCIMEQNALSASCVVMNPNTGEILAMVTKPDYDNNEPPRYDLDLLRELTRNKPVTDVYEPGSTFKLITTAAALDSGAVSSNSHFNCMGYRIIDGQKINCWSDKPHGNLSLTGAVQNSCNPAFMDMAMAMGTQTFYDYIYDFGFGSKSGVKLYGESGGIVTAEKYVKNVDLARIGFGQAIAVTPLQLVTAVSAIVNGGNLMQPYIVEKIISPEGEILEEYTSEVVNEVVSDYTSDTMLQIMQNVVDNGSGRNCQIPGYEIGGKTGTAQKYGEDGQVLHDKHISSFIAVAPIKNPQLVVLITVDEPSAGSSYGSIVAAPYVKDFLEDALPYLNILPNNSIIDTSTKIEVPDVIGMTIEEAEIELMHEGFGCISEGFDGKIVTQIPGPGTMLKSGSNVIVQLEQVTDNGESFIVEVPDLLGLSPTEAMELLEEFNLSMRIVSSGNVVMEQEPSRGTEVYKGTQVAVHFEYFEKENKEDETEDQ